MSRAFLEAELLALRARVDEVIVRVREDAAAAPTRLKPKEYAAHSRVSIYTVRRWVKRGMPKYGKGKNLRIDPGEADQWRRLHNL